MYVYSKMDINKPTAVQNMWRNVLDICRNSVQGHGGGDAFIMILVHLFIQIQYDHVTKRY
jgi:hypothetical protein